METISSEHSDTPCIRVFRRFSFAVFASLSRGESPFSSPSGGALHSPGATFAVLDVAFLLQRLQVSVNR